jgi:hypothetical protein
MNLLDEATSIVAAAKAHGWVTVIPQPALTMTGDVRKQKRHNFGFRSETYEYQRSYQRSRRAELVAQGLTQRGTFRKTDLIQSLESQSLFIIRLSRQ